jgi:phosphopantothenoylcysteine decarboxylase/phosphopantothenate--cysteine ligase
VAAPTWVRVVHVGSTLELAAAVQDCAPEVDAVIMAAAVADYRPEFVADSKIKKEVVGDRVTLELVRNPDILARLAETRRPGQLIVGFAAETEPDRDAFLALGRAKIARKGSDLLILNRVGWREGFGGDDNTIVVLDRRGAIVMEASGSKQTVADRILDAVVARLA